MLEESVRSRCKRDINVAMPWISKIAARARTSWREAALVLGSFLTRMLLPAAPFRWAYRLQLGRRQPGATTRMAMASACGKCRLPRTGGDQVGTSPHPKFPGRPQRNRSPLPNVPVPRHAYKGRPGAHLMQPPSNFGEFRFP